MPGLQGRPTSVLTSAWQPQHNPENPMTPLIKECFPTQEESEGGPPAFPFPVGRAVSTLGKTAHTPCVSLVK